MSRKNTNIIPITKARSTKRFQTRSPFNRQSTTKTKEGGRSLLDLLHPVVIKCPGVPTKSGKRMGVDANCVEPRFIVGPVPPVYPEETNMMIELIRISLSESSQYSATLFTDCTVPISREQFYKPFSLVDDGRGAVYAFFNEEQVLYVGTTNTSVQSLLNQPTAAVVDSSWWPNWTSMRFLPLKSASDRLILEGLLILSLSPIANQKLGTAAVNQFLTELEGD